CKILLEFSTRRILRASGPVNSIYVPPGSTIKPFTISALIAAKKLAPSERFICPVELVIKGRSFFCVHPATATPMSASTAIAYSCNCFVAHFAARLDGGELARYLIHSGFAADRLRRANSLDERRLQALGADGVSVTPEQLAFAYRSLSARAENE